MKEVAMRKSTISEDAVKFSTGTAIEGGGFVGYVKIHDGSDTLYQIKKVFSTRSAANANARKYLDKIMREMNRDLNKIGYGIEIF